MSSRIFQLARATQFRAARVAAPRVAARTFVSSASRFAAGPPLLQGEGVKDGEIASDEQQATGIERFELLGRLQGVDVFDQTPLDSSRVGTVADPIIVESMYPERIVGCTGVPADSHETIWVKLDRDVPHRRCVFHLEFIGPEPEHHH
ncbi:Cytochrome c oxidase subunit 4 [Malassezia cuniculi]|uniref:Cytochrome c oxidase subunit 4 n=1 Tax=Malassezia cuniculi TaxID=948313 RepID=A0AAF0ERT5_9BASI|nr:Cytochrome c oxidase subunit 4 [Malassezia cuniculi]